MVALNLFQRASLTCSNTISICLSHPSIPECINAAPCTTTTNNPLDNRSLIALATARHASKNAGQIVYFAGLTMIITLLIFLSIGCVKPHRRRPHRRSHGFFPPRPRSPRVPSWISRASTIALRPLRPRFPRPRIFRARTSTTTSRVDVSPLGAPRPTARDMLTPARAPPQVGGEREAEIADTDLHAPRASREYRQSWEGRPRTPPPSYAMSGRDRVHLEGWDAAGAGAGARRGRGDAAPRYSLVLREGDADGWRSVE